MLQKLCFSSLILLLEASPAAQLSLFLLLSLGFTILQANRKPYRDTAGGAIAMIVNLSIFFLLLSALLASTGMPLPDALVIMIAVSPLVAVGSLILHTLLAPCYRHRTRNTAR